jgi:hypothetical protein
MNLLQQEYNEFRAAHRHRGNQLFHVLCGGVYITCACILLPFRYLSIAPLGYLLLVWITLSLYVSASASPISSLLLTSLILLLFYQWMESLSLSPQTLLILGLIFYLLPELSHYLTNEKTVMTIENLTPLKAVMNVIYLLPFSIMTLLETE